MGKKAGYVDSGFVKTCDELVIDLLETVFLNWIANQYLHSQKYVIQQVVLARPIPWYKTWTLQRIRVMIFTNMHAVALLNGWVLFWAFHSIFVFCWFWPMKLRKCLFTFFKSLACLALQMETIVKKITQPKLPKRKNEITKIFNEPGNRINFGSIEETLDLSCILLAVNLVFQFKSMIPNSKFKSLIDSASTSV